MPQQGIVHDEDEYERNLFSQSSTQGPPQKERLRATRGTTVGKVPYYSLCHSALSQPMDTLPARPAPVIYKAPKVVKLAEFAGDDELDAETWLFQAQQRFLLENIDSLLHTR